MGTSGSRPDPRKNSPLIPPWADQDPPRPAPTPDGAPDPIPDPPKPPPPPPPDSLAPDNRYLAFRTSYGHFARTGSADSGRQALGHYARTSAGGSRAASTRVARAARTGGGALASFASAASGVPATGTTFNAAALAGQPVDVAIDAIVDAFCPPGILDEDLARAALAEALAVALTGADVFDPNAIDANAVRVATLTFAAELVFHEVAGHGANALAQAPNMAAAVAREAQLRSYIREAADAVGTPIIAAAGGSLSATAFSGLVTRLVEVVTRELATW